MRWLAVIFMWLATAGATVGTAAVLRPDSEGAAAFVAFIMGGGAAACTFFVIRHEP